MAHAVAAQLDSAGVISVREGDDLAEDMEAESNRPFSPLVTFQWMHNSAQLNSSSRVLLNGYNITIVAVQREDAGEYQLVVTNSAGFGTGNFTLDVLCKLIGIALHNLECVPCPNSKETFFLQLSN